MDFSDVLSKLAEHDSDLAKLKQGKADLLTLGKVEKLMVRDMLIFMYTSYQREVINAVLKKARRHSNNHEAIVNFVSKRIQKTHIDTESLSSLLGLLLPKYAAKFNIALQDNKSTTAYNNIINGRINVAHRQGDNVQIGSLAEVRTSHQQAERLLASFESSMW